MHQRIAERAGQLLWLGQSCLKIARALGGRRDYGERRIIAYGVVDGIELTVVHTDREVTPGQIVRRIMSVWRSNRRERTLYKKAAGADTPAAGVDGSRVAS